MHQLRRPPFLLPEQTHLRRRLDRVHWGSNLGVQVQLERPDDSLEAEEVVSVRGDLDFELVRLASWVGSVVRRLLVGGLGGDGRGRGGTHVLVELEAVLEEEVVKLLESCESERSAACCVAGREEWVGERTVLLA